MNGFLVLVSELVRNQNRLEKRLDSFSHCTIQPPIEIPLHGGTITGYCLQTGHVERLK